LTSKPPFDLDDAATAICKAERLVLLQPLGRGSFKQAYLAKSKAGDTYALKVIRDPVPSPRTEREISSLIRCNHASIARLVKVGSILFGGLAVQYIIEEFLPGGTLSDRINPPGAFTQAAALDIGSHLIRALHHLWQLNLVHRDIKPDNIMFRGDNSTPVLVDFGCVRDLSASSLTLTWLLQGPGTPYFASPEQLNNQKLLTDWRSDQFSLGVTLYFAHTGSHPYQHPGEPVFAPATVERVALRGQASSPFLSAVRGTALAPIERMVSPWPVQRFRIPADLLSAWQTP
jgi:serine/threonine protein kinase